MKAPRILLHISADDLAAAVLEVLPRKVSIARAIIIAAKKRASLDGDFGPGPA